MTAQDAFRNWLVYCALIGAVLFRVAVLVVALTSSRERDKPK